MKYLDASVKSSHDDNQLNTSVKTIDEPINAMFEKITRIATLRFKVPIVLITVMDSNKQAIKAIHGLEISASQVEDPFCIYTIENSEVMVVEDARVDPRFQNNSLVTQSPNIVFYAGCPKDNALKHSPAHLNSVILI